MEIKIEKLGPKLKAAIEAQYFEVGILEPAEHREAKDKNQGLTAFNEKKFLNGWARKAGTKVDGEMQEIGGELQKQYNWLGNPFKKGNEKQAEILNFAKAYISEIQKARPSHNRVRNLVQAIVRNPILRGDYGSNSTLTLIRKGFDRTMIDTGQFFNAIQARVVKNVQK